MQLAVLLRGKLKGMGRETTCEFVAMRRHIPDSGKNLYSELRFLDVPAGFPEGDYVASFEQFTVAVKYRQGSWLIGQELTTGTAQSGQGIVDVQRGPASPLRALRLAADESYGDPQD